MRYIWNNKETLLSLRQEDAVQQLMANQDIIQPILKNYPNLLPFLQSEIEGMIRALRKFPDDMIHHECEIQDDQIGYIDEAGNLQFSIYSYPTTFAYLYYQKQGRICSDTHLKEHLSITISCGSILYSELPNFFQWKIGLTATLEGLCEDENKILDNYAFTKRSFIPSTFEKQQLIEKETQVTNSKDEYFKAIKDDIDDALQKNQACFVVFKETKDVMEFHKHVVELQRTGSHFTLPEVLTEMVSNKEKTAIVSRATSQRKITLMTRLYGRGIDFICREKALIDSGGVHIISTFYPESLIEEIQIKGRTCRQDDPGSFRKILFIEDLLKEGLISNVEEYSKQQDWDFLATKRQEVYSRKFEAIHQTLESNKNKHQVSLELAKNIEDGDTETVYSKLKSFQ